MSSLQKQLQNKSRDGHEIEIIFKRCQAVDKKRVNFIVVTWSYRKGCHIQAHKFHWLKENIVTD